MSDCQTCADLGRAGSCARLRCYCGHKDCWAAASWTPMPPLADFEPSTVRPVRRSR